MTLAVTQSCPKDELLLPYLEGILGEKEREDIETHVNECQLCSSKVRALRETIALLKEYKEIFCPDPLEIHQFYQEGDRERFYIPDHLKICGRCRSEVAVYETSEKMPLELWRCIQQRLEKPVDQVRVVGSEKPTTLFDRLAGWFRKPAFAVSAAAAAVIIILLIYPREVVRDYSVGLSSVAWEDILKPKTLQKKTVILVLWKDPNQTISQEKIDSIYRDLKPTMEVSEKYNLIPPAIVSSAIEKREINPYKKSDLLSGINKKLDASLAVLATISSENKHYDIHLEFFDAASGKKIISKREKKVTPENLNATLRQLVFGTLLEAH